MVASSLFSRGDVSDSIHFKKRKQWVIGGNAVGYTSAMAGLYQLWYAGYPTSTFHFFNDNKEWLQMDKVGHVYSCYYEGLVGKKMMQWAGYSDKASTLIGGSYGFLIQTTVEVMDGFSKEWGASWGDVLANAAGTSLFIGQELIWQEQRINLKVSYRPSHYAAIRPNVLGSSPLQRVFKDYNGQTYWLSANCKSFLKEDSKIPAWLNVAIGYGADGMVGGFNNQFETNGTTYNYTNLPRNRQFYLSPDIDLTKIETNKKWLKTSLVILNCLKTPLPGLGYDNKNKLFFKWLMF